MYRYIDRAVHLNIYRMMDESLWNTRISMTDSEKNQFIQKHIRNMKFQIDEEGSVSLELRSKIEKNRVQKSSGEICTLVLYIEMVYPLSFPFAKK